jgi:hypothetical protein
VAASVSTRTAGYKPLLLPRTIMETTVQTIKKITRTQQQNNSRRESELNYGQGIPSEGYSTTTAVPETAIMSIDPREPIAS